MTTALALNNSDGAMAIRPAQDLMPAMTIEQVIARYNVIIDFTKRVMKKGRDYGVIPGTDRRRAGGGGDDETPSNDRNTLLKPGAEKLCTLFGFVPEFEDYRIIEDWEKGLFYYAFRCKLTRHGELVAEGIGSCNSREKKYRRGARACPDCGAATLKRSKYPPRDRPNDKPGWYCDQRAGGCGRNFNAEDPALAELKATFDPNDACDQINTLQKMAQKRALVAATLTATNASEFFTQDVEDMDFLDTKVVESKSTGGDAGNDEQRRQETKPLATPEQVNEIVDLLNTHVIKGGLEEKWLAKAGVDRWEAMPRDAIGNCIKYIKEKCPLATTDAAADGDAPAPQPSQFLPNAELKDDARFDEVWMETMTARQFSPDDARLVLASKITQHGKQTLSECDVEWRDRIIAVARRGEFDHLRMKRGTDISPPAPEPKPDPKPDAKPVAAIDLAKLVEDFDVFFTKWLEAAMDNGWSEADAHTVLGRCLRRIGRTMEQSRQTTPTWRVGVLTALREKRIEKETGAQKKPEPAAVTA
jgi:hypothetical protein